MKGKTMTSLKLATKKPSQRNPVNDEFDAGGVVKVLVVLGGFTESPYLLSRVKQTFASRVGSIVCPPNPGSGICQGAVALAFNPSIIMSRICKRTYGYSSRMPFESACDQIE